MLFVQFLIRLLFSDLNNFVCEVVPHRQISVVHTDSLCHLASPLEKDRTWHENTSKVICLLNEIEKKVQLSCIFTLLRSVENQMCQQSVTVTCPSVTGIIICLSDSNLYWRLWPV